MSGEKERGTKKMDGPLAKRYISSVEATIDGPAEIQLQFEFEALASSWALLDEPFFYYVFCTYFSIEYSLDRGRVG